MDKLDYDLKYVSGVFKKDEGFVVDIGQKQSLSENEQMAKAVDFSNKIVVLLMGKLKAHNSEHSKRVKLHQLREAFCKGAKMYETNKYRSLVDWGLARVNLFLRISSGKIKDINLELDKNNSYNNMMDIANHFTPSDDDFEQAATDVKNHDLDSHFDSVDELYIDEKPEPSYFWTD